MSKKDKAGGGGRAPWMPFYGRDFYADGKVQAMTWEERGIYQALLWLAWDEGSIPADVGKLARIAKIPLRRFNKVWEAIAPCWSPNPAESGTLVQERQERVRSASGELSEKMRALAERRHAKEAAARMAAGQHAATESADAPHAPPQCEPACEPACEAAPDSAPPLAVLTTSTSTTRATEDIEIASDVPLVSGPEGVSPPVPEDDQHRAKAAASLVDGATTARAVRA